MKLKRVFSQELEELTKQTTVIVAADAYYAPSPAGVESGRVVLVDLTLLCHKDNNESIDEITDSSVDVTINRCTMPFSSGWNIIRGCHDEAEAIRAAIHVMDTVLEALKQRAKAWEEEKDRAWEEEQDGDADDS